MVVVLPGAVGAEHAEDFAGGDIERDTVHRMRGAIAFGEARRFDNFGLDGGFTHRRPNLATAPTMISNTAPMMPTPATPHTVEVVTVTRKSAVPVSPRAEAVNPVT